MGEPDLSIDLASCVLYNGAALTAPDLALSDPRVRDESNGVNDALTYPYLTLTGTTLEIATSTQAVPVAKFVMKITYRVVDGSTYDDFQFIDF